MIAEVYPLRRLSRTIRFFDYEIPDARQVVRGSFVEIPIRAQTVLGIVKRVKDLPPRGIRLKSILRVLPQQSLRDEELSFFESIADSIAQPTANVLYVSLPQPTAHPSAKTLPDWRATPLTIPVQESATVARLAKQMTERRSAFVQVPDLRRTAAVLAHYFNQRPPEKRVIVCPHVQDVRLLSGGLSAFHPLMLTGEESPSERFNIWQTFRSSKEALLLTTRAGMLYVDASTACVCVIRSGHPDHVQHDRNPRLDNRVVMGLFAEKFVANLFFLDVCPLVDDLIRFTSEHILSYPLRESATFINASKERPTSQHVAMSTSCVEAMTSAVENQKRVLLIYNKKGYGIRLRCQDCDHRLSCTRCGHLVGVNRHTFFCVRCGTVEPIPLKCPSCRSTHIRVRGFGSERIAEVLQQWFPKTTIEIIDKEHPKSTHASLVLATRYYLENIFNPFKPDSFAFVIHLDPDTPLFSPTFRATERAIWSVAEWTGLAHSAGAKMLVQTEEEDLFRTSFDQPVRSLSEEIRSRQEFNQPPFSHWLTITLKEEERKKRELEEHLLKQGLERINGVSVSSFPSERLERSVLQVRVVPEQLQEVLGIFTSLDDRYIIDMNAFS